MVSISIHNNAKNDLLAIKQVDRHSAALILTFLQELKIDPDWLNKLLMYGDNQISDQGFNAQEWQALKKTANLWRLKLLDCPAFGYRVIYGYHWQIQYLVIYAVVDRRDFNYEVDTDISRRILSDWNET